MTYLPGFIGIVVPAEDDADGMPEMTKGQSS